MIMKLIVISLLIASVTAFPSEDNVTMEILNNTIERIKGNPKSVADYVLQPLLNMTEVEKQQILDLINKIVRGEIENITDSEEMLRIVVEEAPAFAAKAESMFDNFKWRFEKLDDQGKSFMRKLEKTWYLATYVPDDDTFFRKLRQLKGEIFTDVQKFTPETWKSLEELFPEHVRNYQMYSRRMVVTRRSMNNRTPLINMVITESPEMLNAENSYSKELASIKG
ncbi:hypothetical protein KIN20_023532 [Parelaphostrongylus tenuis]|uniref:Uncharacterized protein n=1 Tax=Parelaphostrongylus tenuis TaxID=148309 RepID=A0AAD5QVX2_PARTN|nr:hypothetical protein KIN20_023532 [Parelaphostrongylus tenuis]